MSSYFCITVFIIVIILLNSSQEQYQYLGGYAPNIYGKEQWKSVVVVEFDSTHVCSGTVIANDLVLTAAHCVDRQFSNNHPFSHSNLTCRVGGFINDLSDSVIPVEKVFYHPKYNLTAGIADLAVLKLRFPVRPGVKSINLPSDFLSYGAHCHLVGWKDLEYDPNVTRRIANIIPLPNRTIYVSEQALMDLSACEDALREINFEIYNEVMSSKVSIISPTSICTKQRSSLDDKKMNESFTDSGGPILCDDELHGVQSFMLEMKDGSIYFISTKVDKYMPWIANLTMKHETKDSRFLPILTEEDLAKDKGLMNLSAGGERSIELKSDEGNTSNKNSVSNVNKLQWSFAFVNILFDYYMSYIYVCVLFLGITFLLVLSCISRNTISNK